MLFAHPSTPVGDPLDELVRDDAVDEVRCRALTRDKTGRESEADEEKTYDNSAAAQRTASQ